MKKIILLILSAVFFGNFTSAQTAEWKYRFEEIREIKGWRHEGDTRSITLQSGIKFQIREERTLFFTPGRYFIYHGSHRICEVSKTVYRNFLRHPEKYVFYTEVKLRRRTILEFYAEPVLRQTAAGKIKNINGKKMRCINYKKIQQQIPAD